MTRAVLRWLVLIGIDTAAQIVFKIAGSGLDATGGLGSLLAHAIVSPWVIGGLALYLATFLVWMTILRDAELSRVFPMTAITTVSTAIVGRLVFAEAISTTAVAGIGCIVIGVSLLARQPVSTERK